MTLDGRVAVVTGGSQGIGKDVVRRLLEEGAKVAFCARNAQSLKATAEELSSISPNLLSIQADVTREVDIAELVRATLERFSHIDILVNNAGVYGPIGLAWEVDPVEWREALTTNLVGAFLACRAIVPVLVRQRRGKIINMSGGGAATPFPRYTAYAASKAALVRFTETLALEVADYNIQVNTIAPGFVATSLHQRTLEAGERAGAEFLAKTKDELERGGVDPATPAALVAFLASDNANRITGKFISSVWDDWKNFEQHVDEIAKTDVYTLRRIVPRDRSMDWK